MSGTMDCFGLTDVGKKREQNEDQFLVADLNKTMLIHQTSLRHEEHTRLFGTSQGKLMLVADGMGGHAAGEHASALAVQSMAHYMLNTMSWFFGHRPGCEEEFEAELKDALERCQERIELVAAGSAARRGMGTTLTMAYVLWPQVYIVHAGDSRCYLLRGGRLEQITTDHTVAQQLIEQGALSREQAEGSRWSHMLWNCVGGGSHELSPDVFKATLQTGDTLLLCSDGLSGQVTDEQIRKVLQGPASAEQACRELVRLANDQGGPDNITVVVAHFRAAEPAQAQRAQTKVELADTDPHMAPLPASAAVAGS